MRTGLRLIAAAFVLAHVTTAFADNRPAPSQEADTLFREGKSRLAARDYTTACPLFRASFEKDPATGTLLALAMCHERQGELSTALTEYRDVAARSRSEGRTDRENAALVRVAALEQQLGVTSPAPTAAVAPTPTATPAPAQPAPIAVATPAPAPEPEATTPTVAPVVVARERAAAVEITPPRRNRESRAPEPSHGINLMQGTGLALIGVGVFALGTAGAFTIQAINKNSDSKDNCVVNRCNEAGRDDRLDARSAGTAATVSALIGAALAGGGAAMYFLLGETEQAPRARTAVAPWLGYRSFGAAAQGTF